MLAAAAAGRHVKQAQKVRAKVAEREFEEEMKIRRQAEEQSGENMQVEVKVIKPKPKVAHTQRTQRTAERQSVHTARASLWPWQGTQSPSTLAPTVALC